MFRNIKYDGHNIILVAIPKSARNLKGFHIKKDTGNLFAYRYSQPLQVDIYGNFEYYEVIGRATTVGHGICNLIESTYPEFDPKHTLVLLHTKQRKDFGDMDVIKELAKTRKLPSSKESVKEQIYLLEKVAYRFGLNEAFDYLKKNKYGN